MKYLQQLIFEKQLLLNLLHATTVDQTNIAMAITIRINRNIEAAGVARAQMPRMDQPM
jgi:hypothetical protein